MNCTEMAVITEKIKSAAIKFGVDLVGIADPARWINAPSSRRPQALMADCKAAIVLGIHYLDSCIELGGAPDPRFPGPAVSNHIASEHCNYAAFRLCKYIETMGFQALMTPSTGWWNYRATPDSPRGFAGDITHYYAAVAAGLGEIGWNNICLSPNFGPRQRWITLVTNAPLVCDPMYHGDPLCDRCKLCEKYCPSKAFEKEVKGLLTVDYGERKFSFPNKNLWRCALGENFQLDSFMEYPEKIDEKVAERLCEEAAKDPAKRFTWKMGMCLKWCVPPKRRYMDRKFTTSIRRRRDVEADYSEQGISKARKKMEEFARSIGVSALVVVDKTSWRTDVEEVLPNAASVIVVLMRCMPGAGSAMLRAAQRNALWIARKLEINFGYDTLVESGIDPTAFMDSLGYESNDYKMHMIVSSIPYRSEVIDLVKAEQLEPIELKKKLALLAVQQGADLFGVTTVERVNVVAEQVDEWLKEEPYFIAEEQGWGLRASRPIEMKGKPKNPVIKEQTLKFKCPEEYLEGAKTVIVIGQTLLNGSVKNVGRDKAAHYGVTVHKELILQNEEIANEVARVLEVNGYRAVITSDLEQLGSKAYAWLLPGIRANSYAALCAGMGWMAKNGLVVNERYGSRVRYVAIVTDAPMEADVLAANKGIQCTKCNRCVEGCPTGALHGKTRLLRLEENKYIMADLNHLRCDWAARYGLLNEGGPKYLGNLNEFSVPETISQETLLRTLKESDRLQITNFAPIVEHCLLDCPFNTVK